MEGISNVHSVSAFTVWFQTWGRKEGYNIRQRSWNQQNNHFPVPFHIVTLHSAFWQPQQTHKFIMEAYWGYIIFIFIFIFTFLEMVKRPWRFLAWDEEILPVRCWETLGPDPWWRLWDCFLFMSQGHPQQLMSGCCTSEIEWKQEEKQQIEF